MDKYLSIPEWDKLQHYKDRTPPWIKLHNDLLENYDFECLPDASKAHLLCIMLLASRTNNKINPDPKWIGRKIGANSKVDIEVLIESGFIQLNQPLQQLEQDASNALQTQEQNACLEESRGEQRREKLDHREAVIESCFARWWAVYPRKTAKKKAYELWSNKLKRKNRKPEHIEALTDRICEDISEKLGSLASGDKKYFGFDGLHATTYLNQERWNDE